MCGRFSLFAPGDALARRFGLVEVPVYAPRYNIAPTQDVVVIRAPRGTQASQGDQEVQHESVSPVHPEAVWMQWGVRPGGRGSGSLVINARSESVHERPLFREAFATRRCLVPADGFFEWRSTPGGKSPHWFHPQGDGPFALAGIYWPGTPSREESPSRSSVGDVVILTTQANPLVSKVHDRMPVILEPGQDSRWLHPDATPEDLRPLLVPFAQGKMQHRRVSKRVNDSSVEGPALVEPDAQQRLF